MQVRRWATESTDLSKGWLNYVFCYLPLSENVVEILIVWTDVEIACSELGLVVLRKRGYFGDIDDVLVLAMCKQDKRKNEE